MATSSKNDVSAMLMIVKGAVNTTFAKKTLVLEGKAWKEADIVSAIQDQIEALQASDAAHATWIKSVADQRTSYKTVIVPLLHALRNYVALLYGTNSQTYLDFGFAPPTKAKPSTETRSAALEQSRATRKARGTLGKKQRLGIKGVVQPVTSAPTESSPSTPSATPATVASAVTPSSGSGQSH
jgi:hypothetical protein